jgi:hypothetical protein
LQDGRRGALLDASNFTHFSALPQALSLRQWKTEKLNVSFFKSYGFTADSRKLGVSRSKTGTASFRTPS